MCKWLAQVDDWEKQPAGPVSNRLRVAARHDCDSLSIILVSNSASKDVAAETPVHADGTEARNVAFALSPEVRPPHPLLPNTNTHVIDEACHLQLLSVRNWALWTR